MNCNEARRLIECYQDGELDAPRAQEIEGHLEICATCGNELAACRTLHQMLATPELYARADRKTLRNVKTAIKRAAEPRRSAAGWWRGLTAACAAVSVIAAALIISLAGRPDTLTMEVTSAHIRSLLASHLIDVASSDRHTVKPWFAGRLDFSPPVKDLSDAGFVLAGGRIEYLNHQPAAALVYKHQQHVVNVFVWPRSEKRPTHDNIVRDGFNIVRWTGRQMDYWAVSDLNRVELEKLQHLFDD